MQSILDGSELGSPHRPCSNGMPEENGNWRKTQHPHRQSVKAERKDGPAETETRNSGLTGAVTTERGLPKDKHYLRVLAAVDGIST